jgi:hypothetical protein
VTDHLGQADEHLRSREELLQTLETEQSKIKQEVERIYRLYNDGQIDGDGFGRFYKPLQQRQGQLNEELPRLQVEVDLLKINHLSADKVLSEAQDLYTRWPHLNQEEKRSVVDSITEKITIGKDGIDIDLCHLPSRPFEDMTKWQSKLQVARATAKRSFPFPHSCRCRRSSASASRLAPLPCSAWPCPEGIGGSGASSQRGRRLAGA